MNVRRRAGLAAIAVVALLLTGCGAMPTSGGVFAGEPADEAQRPNFEQLPDEPVAGSDPQTIVEDFIDAATSPTANYRVANMFVAPEAPWNPRESVQVIQGDRDWTPVQESDTRAVVTLETGVQGSVDDVGVLETFASNQATFVYTLTRATVDDEWRIVEAPPGIVIDRAWFEQIYQPYSLYFFDATMSFLVPDRRYFPSTVAAGRIASALVAGPNADLEPAVVSAFPEGTSIRDGSVAIDATVATVAFDELPEADADTIGSMHAQLLASLRAANARSLNMSLGTTPLTGTVVTATSPAVDTRAVVIKDDKLGYLTTSAEFTAFDGFTQVAALKPTSVVYQPAREVAVVRAGNGVVMRLTANGDAQALDDRAGLAEPTIDPSGYVWSVPRSDPDSLRVVGPDGASVTVGGGIIGLTAVQAIQMSRDGTRLAVVGTIDAHPTLVYFPVVRTDAGLPTKLAAQVEIAELPGAGLDLAWLDDLTVGVLSKKDDGVTLLSAVIGGSVSAQAASDKARFVSGVNASASVRLLTTEQVLYTRRASAWTKLAEDVQVLGVLQASN